jgi:phosphoribosyl-ATP pyrophosphohydrolase
MVNEQILQDLWNVIQERAAHPVDTSYVSRVLKDQKGLDKALEKLGEESIEFILAAKNGVHDRTIAEAADLLFHYLIALHASGIPLDEVLTELVRRRKK